MSHDISLTFLGHSAWRIQHETHDILIDPFITGNPLSPVTADELSPTHILLTHGHGDHVGDTVEIAKRSGAQVIAVFEVINWLEKQGLGNLHPMSIGGGNRFDFGTLKLTPAWHGSALPDGSYGGDPAGLLLTIDSRVIYHAGDTALFSDMKLIARRAPIDVALLPIGDNFTMGIDDAALAVEFLEPRLAIPMHYNTFAPITVDPEEFRSKVEAKGHKALILNPGESYELKQQAPMST